MTNEAAGPTAQDKFGPDGTARHFPGNTVVSLVPSPSAEADLLTRAVDHLREAIAHDSVLLPPSSWHMTVFELLCDQVRDSVFWSTRLDADASLDAVDEFVADCVPTIPAPHQLTMHYNGISAGDTAIGVSVEPADATTTQTLIEYRNALSEVTGIRFPNHDDYRFHITLAYTLTRPSAATRPRLDEAIARVDADLNGALFAMPEPVLTFFSDMTEFAVDSRPTRPQ
ncbi:MAG: DUF1868 domain-containing protein [Ilumatobacter sp.]